MTLAGTLVALAPVTNSGRFTLNGGAVVVGESQTYQFGQLGLGGGGALKLPDARAVVRFKESRTVAWNSGATLVVANWSGSTNGGGVQRIIFGSNAQGISQSQLGQLRFENPVGFPNGVYPAKILATGEVVPVQPEAISFGKSSSGLRLIWSGNYELFTATNVAGPYIRVSGVSSPYTNSFSDRQRFFQLRLTSP
jgi:hypothetical protein